MARFLHIRKVDNNIFFSFLTLSSPKGGLSFLPAGGNLSHRIGTAGAPQPSVEHGRKNGPQAGGESKAHDAWLHRGLVCTYLNRGRDCLDIRRSTPILDGTRPDSYDCGASRIRASLSIQELTHMLCLTGIMVVLDQSSDNPMSYWLCSSAFHQ